MSDAFDQMKNLKNGNIEITKLTQKDKFLFFSFQFGKIFSIVLLIIFLVLMLCSVITTAVTFKQIKLNAPTFQEIHANMQAEKNAYTLTENTQAESYILLTNEISKKYLSNYGKILLLNNVKRIDSKYRIDYLYGFQKASEDLMEYIKINSLTESQSRELKESLFVNYDIYFQNKLSEKNIQDFSQKSQRVFGLSLLCSSILLFLLCLIVPLLIKIEENTRNKQ